jgi:hypothetical protein
MAPPRDTHLPTNLVDENRIAEVIGCTVAKVRADRHKGTGCPYYKIGRMVRYDLSEVQSWIASKRVTSTSQQAA